LNKEFKPLFFILHSCIFLFICFGYVNFYGIGRDILALEKITMHKNTIYWSPLEFCIENLGYFTNLFSVPVYIGIISLQVIGALLNFYAIHKILPYTYSIFYLILPNLYLASFSTVQMNILIPLWFLFLITQKFATRVILIILSISFHWFTVILIFIYFLSKLSMKRLFLLLSSLPILLNDFVILKILIFCELFVGGSRYTTFIAKYLENLPDIPIILSFMFLVAYFIPIPQLRANIFEDNSKIILKASLVIIGFSFLIILIGLGTEYGFRIFNLAILPVLYLIFKFDIFKNSALIVLTMYLILNLNIVLKNIS
jgi:hypothetical protein